MRTTSQARAIGLGALMGLVLACTPVAQGGEAYRWVDQDGAVHYSDAPPPESARDRARQQGGQEPDPTDTAEAEAQAVADADAERDRHDRMLLRSYTALEDLERTRERRLAGVDARIGLATHKLRGAERRATGFAQALESLPDDNENRGHLEAALATARERVERARAALVELEERRATMAEQFDDDIERFAELMEERE